MVTSLILRVVHWVSESLRMPVADVTMIQLIHSPLQRLGTLDRVSGQLAPCVIMC